MKSHYTYHFSLVVNTGEYLVPGTWFRDDHSLIPSMGIPKNLTSDGIDGVVRLQENCLKLGPQIDEFTRKIHRDDPIVR
jgi:hypothetical protein